MISIYLKLANFYLLDFMNSLALILIASIMGTLAGLVSTLATGSFSSAVMAYYLGACSGGVALITAEVISRMLFQERVDLETNSSKASTICAPFD